MVTRLEGLDEEHFSLLLNGFPLLTRAFWGPVEDWCEEMQRAATTDELKKLGKMTGNDDAALTMIDSMKTFGHFKKACEALEESYVRLFISHRGGITASLHHSAYESEGGGLMGRPAKMMASRLKTMGMVLSGNSFVPADHLAVEVEYLTLLLERALGDGGEDLLATAQEFARTELTPWLKQLTKKLQTDSDCPFYPAAARLLLGMVSLIAD